MPRPREGAGASSSRRRIVGIAAAAVALGTLAAPAAAQAAGATAIVELRDRDGLEAFAQRVSDPASPDYRAYRTIEQLRREFGAAPRATARATRWLRSHGLRATVAPTGTFISAHGSGTAIRAAFAGEQAGAAAAGPGALPVPAELRGVVRSAALFDAAPVAGAAAERSGGVSAAARRQARARRDNVPQFSPTDLYNGLSPQTGSALPRTGTPRGCEAGTRAGFAPNQIHTAYGIDQLHRRGLRGEGGHIALIEVDGVKLSDIRTYADCFGAGMPRITRTTVGTRTNSDDGEETPLDLEVIVTAAPRLSRIDLFTATQTGQVVNFSNSLVQATSLALGSRAARPDAISLSLGVCEGLSGLFLGAGTLTGVHALNDLFALAGASGISVLVAAGDNGAAGCARAANTSIPLAEFPGSSPWVTTVGGTNFELDASNRIKAEVVWNSTPAFVAEARARGLQVPGGDLGVGGGGGHSLVFPRPWYQRAPGLSTEQGTTRVVPDVAMLADITPGYAYYCTTATCTSRGVDGWATVGGTSAATPLLATAVTLMNQDARRRGQPPLGFLNPLIYQLATSSRRAALFNDVKIGTNDVSEAMPGSTYFPAPLGVYPAVRGFDYASGWGSPRLAAFNAAALRAGAGSGADGAARRAAGRGRGGRRAARGR
jgi:kumamolisin